MTLQGNYIELKNLNCDIMFDVIEESQLEYEDNKDGMVELLKTKKFFY